jgi:hypothetical protein
MPSRVRVYGLFTRAPRAGLPTSRVARLLPGRRVLGAASSRLRDDWAVEPIGGSFGYRLPPSQVGLAKIVS